MATWSVDEARCVGCVLCSDLVPQLFVYDLPRQLVVVRQDCRLSDDVRVAAQQALESCPVDAISCRQESRSGSDKALALAG